MRKSQKFSVKVYPVPGLQITIYCYSCRSSLLLFNLIVSGVQRDETNDSNLRLFIEGRTYNLNNTYLKGHVSL